MSVVITIRARGRGTYEARHDGHLLCTSSRQPLLDAARVLLAEGDADPKARIVMRREGSDTHCLSATIEAAAKLTVDETGPRFVRWKPFQRSAVGSPVRFSREDGPEAAEAAE